MGQLFFVWSARYWVLFVRRAGALAFAFLAGESTGGWEAEARCTFWEKVLRVAIKLLQGFVTVHAFVSRESRSESQCGGIVELFFKPLGFLIRFVPRLCGIVEVVWNGGC